MRTAQNIALLWIFLTVIVGLEMHAEGEDKWSVVHKRALEILLAVNIQEGAEEIIFKIRADRQWRSRRNPKS